MKPRSSEYAVEARNLTVKFGDFTAVDNISFSVKRGEIFGFLGANGAGKTTTIRVLCGLLVPTSGDAHVVGLGFEDGGQAIKSKVGYMSQKLTIYQDMTVNENMNFIGSLRKMEKNKLQKRVKELFEFIHFTADPNMMVAALPGGLKQEVSLAASMLHDPEIIFLDEPTAGVAPASRQRFWQLIQQAVKNGKTVFVTTHYMDEAEQCGRIALMRDGKIIALNSPEGLKAEAFPLPLIELEAKTPLSERWASDFRKHKGVASLKPYGMRWHLEPKTRAAIPVLKRKLGRGIHSRMVRPTLEDVFIHMVEGNR
jgi:ABC-2 type transport system ATP-binding protein